MDYVGQPDGRKVLIVEDDPVLLLHNVGLVEDAGFVALEASNADEAMGVLEHHRDIAVVFTDIEMPGSMNGVKLVQAIADRWPPVQLVLASGRVEPRREELPEGSRFFAKPFDSEQLVGVLRKLALTPRAG